VRQAAVEGAFCWRKVIKVTDSGAFTVTLVEMRHDFSCMDRAIGSEAEREKEPRSRGQQDLRTSIGM